VQNIHVFILYIIILAGTPPIIKLSGNTPLTIAPVAIIQPLPICAPSKKVALAPIQQLLPTFIPLAETPCNSMDIDKSE
jgi:hypothetical protein